MFGPEVDFPRDWTLRRWHFWWPWITSMVLKVKWGCNAHDHHILPVQWPKSCPLAGSHWSVSPGFSVYFALESKMLESLCDAQNVCLVEQIAGSPFSSFHGGELWVNKNMKVTVEFKVWIFKFSQRAFVEFLPLPCFCIETICLATLQVVRLKWRPQGERGYQATQMTGFQLLKLRRYTMKCWFDIVYVLHIRTVSLS